LIALEGNKEGLATVTGIVDGTGSVGAAIGQILVPVIQEKFNWLFVFYFFIILVSIKFLVFDCQVSQWGLSGILEIATVRVDGLT
jgi:sugar phosphate permease